MSTVIKTRKAKREPSIASVLRKSFVRFKLEDTGRSIVIARTPSAFISHGNDWGKLVKDQVAVIAKERGLTIASWEDTVQDSVHGLRVNFTTTLAGFKEVFQGDIYADMLHHPENNKSFEFINAIILNGDENRGTVSVSYRPKNASSRGSIRSVLKSVLAEMDKRITGFTSEFIDDDANADVKAFTFTYKDIPVLSSVTH